MIVVVEHNYFDLPDFETCRCPILVGDQKERRDGFLYDNMLDNISSKNPSYCELTALYWLWRNVPDDEVYGLEHYRRFFYYKNSFFSILYRSNKRVKLFGSEKIKFILTKADIVLPKKEIYPVRIGSDYAMKHERKDLFVLQDVVSEIYPECISAFKRIIWNNNQLSPYNMFISRKDVFKDYCEWLFRILFEVERRVDIRDYDSYQRRIFGFMGERLLNVYVEYKGYKVVYLPVVTTIERPKMAVLIGKYILRFIDRVRFLIVSSKKI